MGKRKTYTIVYERDRDGWWVASVKELQGCHTQGRSIAQARERIREAMDLFDVPKRAGTEEIIKVGGVLEEELRAARDKRKAAERSARDAMAATKRAAARLAKAGLSRRDVGELLGVSFQRVQQIVK